MLQNRYRMIYSNVAGYIYIILLTHPPSHLLFHEGHEPAEHSREGWIHVDIIHAFGTNRVALLEQFNYSQTIIKISVRI
jgi:hypothetical protein